MSEKPCLRNSSLRRTTSAVQHRTVVDDAVAVGVHAGARAERTARVEAHLRRQLEALRQEHHAVGRELVPLIDVRPAVLVLQVVDVGVERAAEEAVLVVVVALAEAERVVGVEDELRPAQVQRSRHRAVHRARRRFGDVDGAVAGVGPQRVHADRGARRVHRAARGVDGRRRQVDVTHAVHPRHANLRVVDRGHHTGAELPLDRGAELHRARQAEVLVEEHHALRLRQSRCRIAQRVQLGEREGRAAGRAARSPDRCRRC